MICSWSLLMRCSAGRAMHRIVNRRSVFWCTGRLQDGLQRSYAERSSSKDTLNKKGESCEGFAFSVPDPLQDPGRTGKQCASPRSLTSWCWQPEQQQCRRPEPWQRCWQQGPQRQCWRPGRTGLRSCRRRSGPGRGQQRTGQQRTSSCSFTTSAGNECKLMILLALIQAIGRKF